jgi:putative ABC transport system permease protein
MKVGQSLRMAWRAIRGHKLRSSLTTLGIIIGIGAVITFVTLGASLQAGIIGDVSPGSQSNLYGWASPPNATGGPGAGAQPVFTQADADALSDLDAVDAAYGYSPLPTQTLSHNGTTIPRGDGVIASGPPYIDTEDIETGRQFRSGQREAVINPAAAALFEDNLTVGESFNITIRGGSQTTQTTVVGVMSTVEGQSPFEGFGAAPRIYVPLDPYYINATAQLTDVPRFTFIVVEAAGPGQVDAARDNALGYLRTDSDAGALAGDNLEFTLQTSSELLGQLQDLLDLLQNFIVGIAAISLLVGSIGIANIMLVSVTERTREIGIMKAVGARNRDVLGLFLVESVILGLIGAVLGVALGAFGGWAMATFIDAPLTYPLQWFGVAVVAGVLVGVLAGFYPAWRASRTDPIEALRYE